MSDFWKAQVQSLRSALEAAERLRAMAEENYRSALRALDEVARLLMPEVVQRALEEGRDLSPGELVEAARAQAALLKVYRASSAAVSREAADAELARLREEAARLREEAARAEALEVENEALRQRVQTLEGTVAAQVETINNLREQVRSLRQAQVPVPAAEFSASDGRDVATGDEPERPAAIPAAAATVAPPEPAAPEPVSGVDLASDDPAWAIVRALGETGFCLRSDLAAAAGVGDPGSGSVREMFARLREAGLIREERPGTEAVGRTPYLVSLTEAGREAFRRRWGKEPAPSILDLLVARHKSLEHAYLNLQAASVLRDAGYSVDLFPRDVEVGGGKFAPDLVAAKDGQVIYVECERDTHKAQEGRERKWEIYHQASQGKFYFVVPNKATQNAIISEVSLWAYRHRKALTVHVCSLASFALKGNLWTVREISPRT